MEEENQEATNVEAAVAVGESEASPNQESNNTNEAEIVPSSNESEVVTDTVTEIITVTELETTTDVDTVYTSVTETTNPAPTNESTVSPVTIPATELETIVEVDEEESIVASISYQEEVVINGKSPKKGTLEKTNSAKAAAKSPSTSRSSSSKSVSNTAAKPTETTEEQKKSVKELTSKMNSMNEALSASIVPKKTAPVVLTGPQSKGLSAALYAKYVKFENYYAGYKYDKERECLEKARSAAVASKNSTLAVEIKKQLIGLEYSKPKEMKEIDSTELRAFIDNLIVDVSTHLTKLSTPNGVTSNNSDLCKETLKCIKDARAEMDTVLNYESLFKYKTPPNMNMSDLDVTEEAPVSSPKQPRSPRNTMPPSPPVTGPASKGLSQALYTKFLKFENLYYSYKYTKEKEALLQQQMKASVAKRNEVVKEINSKLEYLEQMKPKEPKLLALSIMKNYMDGVINETVHYYSALLLLPIVTVIDPAAPADTYTTNAEIELCGESLRTLEEWRKYIDILSGTNSSSKDNKIKSDNMSICSDDKSYREYEKSAQELVEDATTTSNDTANVTDDNQSSQPQPPSQSETPAVPPSNEKAVIEQAKGGCACIIM